jgi:hypothetical protein
MAPRGSTFKRCVGPTDVIGVTKAEGCSAAATLPFAADDCYADPTMCGKFNYCLVCMQDSPSNAPLAPQCLPRVEHGGACSTGYASTQCTGFKCRPGLACTQFRSPFEQEIGDHPDVCCPTVDDVDCGAGTQVVDKSGCLTEKCTPSPSPSPSDITTPSMVSISASTVQGWDSTSTPIAATAITTEDGAAVVQTSTIAPTPCTVQSNYCPMAKCKVPESEHCTLVVGELFVRADGACCPELCLFDCAELVFLCPK